MDTDADGEASRVQLVREARSAAALNHPHICTVHEVGHDSGTTFIAMEYVEGQSLRERLDAGGALPRDEVLRYGTQAADALAYAHEHGVIHRDLKAANAMIATGGRLKIVDFGLARRHDMLTSDATTLGTIAASGTPAGTPYAMARSRCVAKRPTPAPTCGRWACCSTKWRPVANRSTRRRFRNCSPRSSRTRRGAGRAACPPGFGRSSNAASIRTPRGATRPPAMFSSCWRRPHAGRRPDWAIWRHRVSPPRVLAATAVVVLLARNRGQQRRRPSRSPDRHDAGGARYQGRGVAVRQSHRRSGQEYFSDGLTDEMIMQLAGCIHGSGSSLGRYFHSIWDDASPIEALGRDLGVEYVLEGSARREGARVRIIATLIQVRDRTQRWSQTYDSEAAGILTLQNDIARGISGALVLTLLPEATTTPRARQPGPPAGA